MTTNDDLKNILLELSSDVASIKTKVHTLEVTIATLKKSNKDLLEEVSKFKKQSEHIEKVNLQLRDKIQYLSKELNRVSNISRKKNLIIHRVDDSPDMNKNSMNTVLNTFD